MTCKKQGLGATTQGRLNFIRSLLRGKHTKTLETRNLATRQENSAGAKAKEARRTADGKESRIGCRQLGEPDPEQSRHKNRPARATRLPMNLHEGSETYVRAAEEIGSLLKPFR